jgi:hypothetical protein
MPYFPHSDFWPGTVAEQDFWQNYRMRASICLPLECQRLDFIHLGSELNADTLISHLIETEEFPFLPQDPQIVLAPWHNNCISG